MTIRSIINWKDSIKDGTMLLRDIVDLEATYDMSDISDNKLEDTLKLIEDASPNENKNNKEKVKQIIILMTVKTKQVKRKMKMMV